MWTRRTRALVLLTLQNASISLLTRQSRLGDPADLYLPSVAVLCTEVVKALVSLAYLAKEHHDTALRKKNNAADASWITSSLLPLRTAILTRRIDLAALLVPSILYAGQNNLLYVALSNLPASVYQVTYQLKILTTAIFSVIFFRRHYSLWKWFALLLLTAGVAIVQMPRGENNSGDPETQKARQDPFIGFAAIFLASISSAIAGCYFEAILKPANTDQDGDKNGQQPANGVRKVALPPPPSLPMRNLQLALVSLPFSLLGMMISPADRQRLSMRGVLHGFTSLSWFVVLNQALGGLLIAAVVKEADSVSKGFATSLAVLLSTVASSLSTQTLPSVNFMSGACLVVSATCLFAMAR